ncbi:MAG: hypothetical protein CMM25_06690 [Rhodospirillaceae bacterium]|nr:hypothetical protein [Rhodospirillaceae bacterium]
MAPYSRSNPSSEYKELIKMYSNMHADGFNRDTSIEGDFTEGQSAFSGQSLRRWLKHIGSLIKITGSGSVLDYGSGKGLQYQSEVRTAEGLLAPSIGSLWGVDDITCFDPGVKGSSVLPNKPFDAVIATDVLEHVPEDDIFWVVDELFSFSKKFVFASIPCYRAAATLPDGRNAHITIRSPLWWLGVFQSARARRPNVHFSTVFLIPIKGQDHKKKVDYLHSFGNEKIDFSMIEDNAMV